MTFRYLISSIFGRSAAIYCSNSMVMQVGTFGYRDV